MNDAKEIAARVDALQQDQTRRDIEPPFWFLEHEKRITALENHIKNLPTKEEFPHLIAEAIGMYGKTSYKVLLIVSGVVGALVVFFGGIKTMLGWIGINIIRG